MLKLKPIWGLPTYIDVYVLSNEFFSLQGATNIKSKSPTIVLLLLLHLIASIFTSFHKIESFQVDCCSRRHLLWISTYLGSRFLCNCESPKRRFVKNVTTLRSFRFFHSSSFMFSSPSIFSSYRFLIFRLFEPKKWLKRYGYLGIRIQVELYG